MKSLHRARLLLPLLLLAAPLARADETIAATDSGSATKPLWELGLAGAVGTQPDYPASDRYRPRPVGFPYFVYRGNIFRSDENGPRVRTELLSNVELTVSGNASFGSHNDGDGPRAGMPKLDYLFELGPSLHITALRFSPDDKLRIDLPLRGVFSVNGIHFAWQGLTFSPLLALQTRALFGSRWSGYAGIGPEWASGRFQRYFYEVDPVYARPDRPAYEAHGGYLGSRLEAGVGRRLGHNFRIFFYGRIDDYAGAENSGSPLYKSHYGYTGLVGLGWSFLSSREMVQVPAE